MIELTWDEAFDAYLKLMHANNHIPDDNYQYEDAQLFVYWMAVHGCWVESQVVRDAYEPLVD